MQSRFVVATFAVVGFLAGGLAPTVGTSQVLPRRRPEPPVVVPAPPPSAPMPVTEPAPPQPPIQPVPAAQPVAPVADQRQPVQSQVAGRAPVAEAEGQARLIRGSQLIGLRVWGPDNQQFGTIKDFIVDYHGDCPTLFFAMAPAVADLGEGYVIVPFTAMTVDFDTRARTDYFRFNVSLAQLRNAPRIEANKWSSITNRQFLTNAQQFYQRIERTVARPETGGRTRPDTGRERGVHQEPGMHHDQGSRPETGTPPESGTRPGPGTRPDTGSRQDTGKTPDGGSGHDAGSRRESGSLPRAGGTQDKDQPQPPVRR
jgi:hypothetical protein